MNKITVNYKQTNGLSTDKSQSKNYGKKTNNKEVLYSSSTINFCSLRFFLYSKTQIVVMSKMIMIRMISRGKSQAVSLLILRRRSTMVSYF